MHARLESSPRLARGTLSQTRWAPWLGLCALTFASAPGLPHAHAQSMQAHKQTEVSPHASSYEALIQAGVRQYALRDWTAAQFHFEQAHRLRPSARTLRALGLTAQQKGRNAEATGLMQRALRSEVEPLTPAMRAELERACAQLAPSIARYRIVLEYDASLRVDGNAPVFDQDELLLDAGRHELVIEPKRAEPISRILEARPGERTELRISQDVQPPAPPPQVTSTSTPTPAVTVTRAAAAPAPAVESRWTFRDRLALGAAVGGAAAFVAGVTFGVLAIAQDDASRDDCVRNDCNERGLEHRDAAFDHATVATVSFVAAGVLLATGLTLHLTDDRASSSQDRSGPGMELQVSVASQRAALTLAGRWQ